ncbi:MAG: hypothetical protein ACRC2S_17085, partial [Waterburya sp.]
RLNCLEDFFGFQLRVNQCEFFELHLISIFIKIILTLLDFGLKQEVLKCHHQNQSFKSIE